MSALARVPGLNCDTGGPEPESAVRRLYRVRAGTRRHGKPVFRKLVQHIDEFVEVGRLENIRVAAQLIHGGFNDQVQRVKRDGV